MPETKHITGSTPYASSGDFRRIFHEETDSLYRLSFMLTADREKAERCFVSGLEDSVKGNPVFKEWARSWARRAIIQCAVRMIDPQPMAGDAHSAFNDTAKTPAAEQAEIAAVLELRPFERFVYVMSVLERYSDQDCAVLLGCARRDVIAARIRALQKIEMQSTFVLSGRQMSTQEAGLHDDGRAGTRSGSVE
jgi:DNA-directed RNA polymerase specialized sigma24 family protein